MTNPDNLKIAFRRVLFCTDLSENADFAFTFALDAAQRTPACELHILHVIPETEAQFWKTYVYEVEDVDNKAKRDLDERIRGVYLNRIPDGLSCRVEYRMGRDWREILDYAKEREIDLIVMGRHGRGTLQKTLFGNVTERVARKAVCAVLIVPLSYEKRSEAAVSRQQKGD